MPNYRYTCFDCEKGFEVFLTFKEYDQKEVKCPLCHGDNIQRKIERIRIGRSDIDRLENLADPDKLAALDDDPKALGQMMRQMSSELGEDMGAEFDEVVDRLESGQNSDQIERELPEISENGSPDGVGDLV
ncbi:MAG: hypothetical protein JEZ06_01340 [Anaerolineaceae bacterium]|nr:hypothetical protein [Anaerolineaceae bacterium]